MKKIELLQEKLENEEEYILKTEIYDFLTNLINDYAALNLKTNEALNELLFINADKLKRILIHNEKLNFHLLEKKLTDDEALYLLIELIKYEKRYLY